MPIGKIYQNLPLTQGERKLSSGSSNSTDSSNSSKTSGYSSASQQSQNRLETYLDKQKMRAIVNRVNAANQVKIEFVTEQHMAAMENASRTGNFAGSFRSAGGPTLDALNQGAAAKGHNILEKTIKKASVEKAYGAAESGNILQLARDKGLIGMVGRWDKETKKITGVYIYDTKAKMDTVFELDLDDDAKIGQYKQAVENKEIIPYTGDYDMHDIISFDKGGKGGHVPVADESEEEKVKNLINLEVSKLDANRPYDFIEKNVVRHGPQVNFVPHMWNHEKDNVVKSGGYLGVVARMGEFPIAFVNKGKWEIVRNWVDLYRYYFENGTKIPSHWQQGGLTERKNGFVATPEHADELDKKGS